MRRRPAPFLRIACAALALAACTSARAAVITVGPPGDANCQYHSLQAAIDAAAASPGLDILRVAAGTYTAQRLSISDAGDLAIEGGFVDCANLVRAGTSTLDGQGANPPGPVISHEAGGRLTLSDLVIQNGNAASADSTSGLGGGVYSSGAGALTVYRTRISSNRASVGGGLFVAPASFDQVKEVTLTGVGFDANTATESGGGLYALHADVRITGTDISYFSGNLANGTAFDSGGGAIYAVDSDVEIDGRMPTNFPFMDGNSTAATGGAIHFRATGNASHELRLAKRAGSDPISLSANSARFGGAIYLRSAVKPAAGKVLAELRDVIVEDNRATQGSAFFVHGANDTGASVFMTANAADMPEHCAPAQRCNRIQHNVGGMETITLNGDAADSRTEFIFYRGLMLDNVAASSGGLIRSAGRGHAHVDLDSSVLANNDAGNATLINVADTVGQTIQNCTIAGNLRVNPVVVQATTAGNGPLRLHNSIVFQPNVPILWLNTGVVADPRNLLVGSGHALSDLAARNIQLTSDPLFVDPGHGDFRPRLGSQAINRWQPDGHVEVPIFDLIGATRPAPPTNMPTPYDFGAYEYGAVIDAIFTDWFEISR